MHTGGLGCTSIVEDNLKVYCSKLFFCFSVYKYCEKDKKASRCEVGDLEHKHAPLAVAGRRIDISETRRFFTDSNLPLAGPASILGHSLLLHDDNAPEHRGNRMACTAIRRLYRHKENNIYIFSIIAIFFFFLGGGGDL